MGILEDLCFHLIGPYLDFFDLFNHPNFNLPDNFLGSPTFGRISSARDPRHIQFGLKLLF